MCLQEVKPFMVPENFVAAGGFGRIYKMPWRGRDVAVKELIVMDHQKKQDGSLEAFRQEVEACDIVSASNSFVHLLGACLKPPVLFLITEFMEGTAAPEDPSCFLSMLSSPPLGLAELGVYRKVAVDGQKEGQVRAGQGRVEWMQWEA